MTSFVKGVAALILSILLLLPLRALSADGEAARTFLSALVLREDVDSHEITEEILLIAEYTNNKYKALPALDNTVRKTILSDHSRYSVYFRGRQVEIFTVEALVSRRYECDEILVGISPVKKDSELLRLPTMIQSRTYGFASGRSFTYDTRRFVALNSDSASDKTQSRARPINEKVAPGNVQRIRSFLSEKINASEGESLENGKNDIVPNVKKLIKVKPDQLELPFIEEYDFNKDGLSEYLAVAKFENESIKYSAISVVNIKNSTVIPLLFKACDNAADSWGNGYDFLDAVDIDGDQVPELVFQVRGYESTGYEIYSLHGGNFVLVFDDVISGC